MEKTNFLIRKKVKNEPRKRPNSDTKIKSLFLGSFIKLYSRKFMQKGGFKVEKRNYQFLNIFINNIEEIPKLTFLTQKMVKNDT